MKKIGFITSLSEKLDYYFPTIAEPDFTSTEPPFTPDDQIAVNYLRKDRNLNIEPVIWGTPPEDLKEFDLLIIRSPWDYTDSNKSRQLFLRWIEEIEKSNLNLLNSTKFIKWMLDKHYLKDFERSGIPIVPTIYTEKEEPINLKKIYKTKGAFIIKPCISAAGVGLRYIDSENCAGHYQEEINIESQYTEFMIQDFIKEIQTKGEWSLIYFGGEYSHSIHKKPATNSILVQAELGGSLHFKEPEIKLIEFGNKVMNSLATAFKIATNEDYNNDALYLRIDIIEDETGYYLSECEGVEPELFFRAKPGSEKTFAKHLYQHLSQ